MAIAKHTTPSDASFTLEGATAWDSNHTVELEGDENFVTNGELSNIQLLDATGDGTKYLADDGVYKTVGGAVDSVNGQTGAVVLTPPDIYVTHDIDPTTTGMGATLEGDALSTDTPATDGWYHVDDSYYDLSLSGVWQLATDQDNNPITDVTYITNDPYVVGTNDEDILVINNNVDHRTAFITTPAPTTPLAKRTKIESNNRYFQLSGIVAPAVNIARWWWDTATIGFIKSNSTGDFVELSLGDTGESNKSWVISTSLITAVYDGNSGGWGNSPSVDSEGLVKRYTLTAAEYARLGDASMWWKWTSPIANAPDPVATPVPNGDYGLDSLGIVWQVQSSAWVEIGAIPTNGYAPAYHNHQAGIERDEVTNLLPAITDNSATSRIEGYLLEQYKQYKIVTQATVDYTTIGAANNTAGTYFICTSAVTTLGAGDAVTEATIDVTSGSVWFFDEEDMDSMTLHTIEGTTEGVDPKPLTFLPNEPNYICANRDTNKWVVLNSVTTPAIFDYLQYVPYFVANFRTGSTAAHNQVIVLQAHGEVESIHQAKFECGRYDIATGALRNIGCTDTTLALTLGGGNVFASYYKYVIPNVSAATRQFNCLWLGGSNWSYTTNTNPVLVNTSYNTSGAMTTMTDTYWACMYMWRGIEDDDHIYTYYSQAEYATQALAQASSIPSSIPPLAEGHSVFVGRIVFQKGQTTAFIGESAFNTVFAAATAITVHNDLAGLNQGEYIHMSAAEAAVVGGIPSYATADSGDVLTADGAGGLSWAPSGSGIAEPPNDGKPYVRVVTGGVGAWVLLDIGV